MHARFRNRDIPKCRYCGHPLDEIWTIGNRITLEYRCAICRRKYTLEEVNELSAERIQSRDKHFRT